MEIIAKIRYDEANRQLVYSAELVANRVPLCGPHVNVKGQVVALDMAHKAIEEGIAKANVALKENGLAAQLAKPCRDKHGNVTVCDRVRFIVV